MARRRRKPRNPDLISSRARAAREEWLAFRAGLSSSQRAYRRCYPRSDEPWQVAEDRRLMRLHAKHAAELAGLRLWVTIAQKLKRTTAAVQSRFSALRAGLRLSRSR